MQYKGDVGLYLSGAPVPLPECSLFITQPTIKQIMQFGETGFLYAVHLLTNVEEITNELRNEGNPELTQKTDFQLLLILIQNEKSLKRYVNNLFELIFPDYDVEYTNNSISFYFKDNEKQNPNGMITIYSFESFQTIIKELFIIETSKDEEEFNPANEAAAKIAEKLKKRREKLKQQEDDNDNSITLFGVYASILSVGLQMDLNIFFNYTPFQIIDAFKRYQLKIKYDLYQKISTTPLMDTSKMEEPEEWTKNLYPAFNNN